MTLAARGEGVRLVECPFCEADLEGRVPAAHLENCEDFHQKWGVSR